MRALLCAILLAACGGAPPELVPIHVDDDGHHYYETVVFSRSARDESVETFEYKRVYMPELDPDPLARAMTWVDAHASRRAITSWPSHVIEPP